MKETLAKLLQITEGCREDMHEPDEQGLTAQTHGHKLDNAIPPTQPSAEFKVKLTRGHANQFETEFFNLATLIALARKADLGGELMNERLTALWKIADHIPELWGDECKDGYVRLNISADAIEAVQAAIMPTIEDTEKDLLLDALKYVKLNLTPLVEGAVSLKKETCLSQNLRSGGADILEKIDEAIRNAKHKPIESYVECGCCGQFHRSSYRGDCRDDNERFNEEDIPENSPITYLEEEN